jgi:hypothetical protein
MAENTKASLFGWLLWIRQFDNQCDLTNLVVFAQSLETLRAHLFTDQAAILKNFNALNVRLKLPLGSTV